MPALFYRDGQWYDALTGLPLSHADVIERRDAFLDEVQAEFRALAEAMGEQEPEASAHSFGMWPVYVADVWSRGFRNKIRETAVRSYGGLTGGSIANIPAKGWETIAGVLDRQTPFAAKFIQDVKAGELSLGQVAARSELYASAATQTWERGAAQIRGVALPAYPAENCRGGSNCRCSWDIEETETEYRCFWKTAGDDRVCDFCRNYGRSYDPYVQKKEAAR